MKYGPVREKNKLKKHLPPHSLSLDILEITLMRNWTFFMWPFCKKD
jgi:hypothetical protein